MKLLIDTWGWLTLHDKREQRHHEVVEFYKKFRTQGGRVYTTDYILDETFTLLFKRLSLFEAHHSVEVLSEVISAGSLAVEWMSPERFTRTLALRARLQDKPNISFTDLTSMVIMEEVGITFILTGDAHFTHVGLNFQAVP